MTVSKRGPQPSEESAHLQERAQRLAEEKSHLQLVVHMMELLSKVPGLDNTVDSMLRIVLENIGGTNVMVYYRVGSDLFLADVFGDRAKLDVIDDGLVRRVFETRAGLEHGHDFSDTKMTTPEFAKAETWVYPLLVGPELVGVLKIEGLHVQPREWKKVLPIFFNFAALLLKNELLGHTKLKQAHDQLRQANAVLTQEISERTRVEQALRESEARYRRSIELTGQIGWATKADGQVEDMPAWRAYSGQSLQEVTGWGWLDALHPDDRELTARIWQEAVQAKSGYETEYRVRRHDDTYRHFEARGTPVLTDEGDIQEWVGVCIDITKRRQAEHDLRETEEQLRQSQRLEAVGSLAGGIAHDFNNLLTTIIGQTEFLRGGHGSLPEYEDALDEIRTAADRAAGLTRQLLAFSRRQALQPRVLNVNDVAKPMAALLESLLGEHIDLVFEADPALWSVEADPGQLEQVIMGLAVNARDAMPQGGTLTIKTTNVEQGEEHTGAQLGAKPGPHVLLTVSDTGCGMDEECLSHIFEPFFTTKEQGKGTGLGLSTIYGIIKQSGGDVWAQSELGKGSTFTVYLPRVEKSVDWSPLQDTTSDDGLEHRSETILVVEDEPGVLRLVTRILAGTGYQVLAAQSPEKAIATAEDHFGGIDLILTDVLLPGMNGRAMVNLLLQRPGFAPRVLYMSGYTRDALVHEGRLDEGVALLEKPFTSESLLQKVGEILDGAFEKS